MPPEAAGTVDAVGQESRGPLSALPGLGALSRAAGHPIGMEISKEGGVVVPGVPSPVPSLFPDFGKWLQRVPYVLRSRCSRYERSFLCSLFAAWERSEQWELKRDRRCCQSSTVELPWNDWERISVVRQLPSLGPDCNCPPFVPA